MWSDFQYDDDTEKLRDLNAENDPDTWDFDDTVLHSENLTPMCRPLPRFTSGFT